MKKYLPIIAAAALIVAGVIVFLLIPKAPSSQGDMLARIREKGKLTIATEGDWPPWTYHGDDNALTGFDVEIGGLIAKGLGVEPDYQEAAWDSLLAGLESGRFDIVCNGVDYTADRAEKYAFSDPYVYTEIVLVVAKDN
jgi:cystine transport system substrate-binding protein